MSAREKLEGNQFGDFIAVRYLGSKQYLCKCTNCTEEKIIFGTNLKNLRGTICSNKKVTVDLTGQQIGEWEVLEYIGNKKYLCKCSCGITKEVLKVNLVNGSSTSCGHSKNNYGDLTGQQFGEWTVLEKAGYKWKCQCSCSKIGFNMAKDLVSGRTKSCGHGYNQFTDISNQQFGLWKVLKYEGNQYYICECSCENHTIAHIRKADLLSGATTSCGCNKSIKAKQALFERYGEIAPNKVSNHRSLEQIQATASKDNLDRFIDNLGYTPTSIQLSKLLGIGLHRTLTLIHKYELDNKIKIVSGSSNAEIEIADYIKTIYNSTIIRNDRQVLGGKELDIYIPEKKLAIEFNGTYWHSTIYKDKNYHQQKTITCAKNDIRLIHIFEYEWINNQDKIKNYLYNILSNNQTTVYARDCSVQEIDADTTKEFCEKHHLQGYSTSKINLGLYNKEELLGVITFSKPRFNHEYEYELIRLCWKTGTKVIGGTEKLLKHFITNYNPESILTYTDITKFTGNVYTRLKFKPTINSITEPNYVWVSFDNKTVLPRYQTQKKKLVADGLGLETQTEDEIMYDLDYLKMYNSGNLKLEYRKET